MIAITLAGKLLILVCVGFFTQRMKLVKEDFDSQLTSFLMNIALPCLIFNSLIAEPFSQEQLLKFGVILILSLVVCSIQLGLGQIYYICSGKSGTGRLMRYGMTFVHFSFFGIPIMEALLGSAGVTYYSIFLIPVRIFYYGLTKSLLVPGGQTAEKRSMASKMKQILLNPCLVAVVIGLLFWVAGWSVPEVINYSISNLSKMSSPIGLILCGLTLGKADLKNLLDIRYLKIPVMRTVIMPALFFGLSRILLLWGLDSTIVTMVVIYTALPVASLMSAYVVMYDPDEELQLLAAGSVFYATVISMITLPVWYSLLQNL